MSTELLNLSALSDDDLLSKVYDATTNLKMYLEECVRRGLSQQHIADAMGVSQPTVVRRMKAHGVAPKQIQKHAPKKVFKDEYLPAESPPPIEVKGEVLPAIPKYEQADVINAFGSMVEALTTDVIARLNDAARQHLKTQLQDALERLERQ